VQRHIGVAETVEQREALLPWQVEREPVAGVE